MITAFLLLALCVVLLYISLLVEGECWLPVVVEQVLLDWFVAVALSLVALCLSVVADDDDLPVTAPSLLLIVEAHPHLALTSNSSCVFILLSFWSSSSLSFSCCFKCIISFPEGNSYHLSCSFS